MSGELQPGATIGAYRIDSFVGRGGMGVVYAAEHVTLGRRVALKVVAPELVSDEAFRDRFLREARLAASLDHPNIIPVYDAGQDGETLYLAMRFVEGENLGAVLARDGALEPSRTLEILSKVAAALDEAHRTGLVHRDVKPDNILLGWADDGVYLTDFGLVRRLDSRTRLTKTGYMMGTLNYMAPEVLRGEDIDARTDVYSLTCVLFECLTGGPPFARPFEPAVISSHLVDPPPSAAASRPQLAPGIDAVIARGMAKERTERYPSCGELIAEARRALEQGGEVAAPTVPALAPPTQPVVPGAPGAPSRPDVEGPREADTGPIPPPPTPPTGAEAGPGASRRGLVVLGLIAGLVVLAAILVVPKLLGGGAADDVAAPTGATGAEGSTATGPSGETTGGFPDGVELVGTLDGSPTFIDVAAGAIWVTLREGTLVRVDKGTGEPTPIPVGAEPIRTTFTGSESRGDVWVVNRGDGTLTRVPLPPGGEAPSSIPLGPEPARSIAPPGTGAVWVAVSGADQLVRVDARTGQAQPIDVGDGPVAVSFTDGSLWVANSTSGTVSRVDPTGRTVIGEVPVGRAPGSLQPAGGFVWVANAGDGTVSAIDPSTTSVAATVTVGPAPAGVTNDTAGGVWVQNREGGSVSRIDLTTRDVQTFDVGARPVSMTKTAGALWLVTDDGRLFRIEPTTGAMTSLQLPGIVPVSISADLGAVWIAGQGGQVLRVATDALG